MIEQTIALAERMGIGRDRFEFQMLYGVRPRLQLQLARARLQGARRDPVRPAVVPVPDEAARRAARRTSSSSPATSYAADAARWKPTTPASPRAPAARRGRLTEVAYQHLRDVILRGTLPVGSVLAESEIAAELKISRTPVRQALGLLLQEGLVEVGARRQLIVRGFSEGHRQRDPAPARGARGHGGAPCGRRHRHRRRRPPAPDPDPPAASRERGPRGGLHRPGRAVPPQDRRGGAAPDPLRLPLAVARLRAADARRRTPATRAT